MSFIHSYYGKTEQVFCKLTFSKFLGFLFLLSFSCLSAQTKKTIYVVDSLTRESIEYAVITSNDNRLKVVSTKNGEAILIPDKNTSYFKVYKMGYSSKIIQVNTFNQIDTLLLSKKYLSLNEVSITIKRFDTIVRNKKFYVNDYRLLPNGNFILLTSKINTKGFEVVLYSKKTGILQRNNFSEEKEEELFQDCFSNFHLITNSYSRQLFFNTDTSFEFLPAYNRSKFDSTLAKCKLKLKDGIIAETDNKPKVIIRQNFNSTVNQPYHCYYKVSNNNASVFYLSQYNKELMEMYLNQEKDAAILRANGKSTEAIESDHDLFYRSVAKKIYNPVFSRNDTVVIFDFQENEIVLLNASGTILQKNKIDANAYSSFRNFEVLYDETLHYFYIYSKEFDKRTINRINILTGKASKKIKIEKTFAFKLFVNNNSIYYLVKEKEWDDTYYLYEQKI
ncbi:MAG: hypothetical protein IPM51_07775 [Sphingobacteriaceae bacterium]|nr:hypothetical protein [Sphingobacteriaceae bacterium]